MLTYNYVSMTMKKKYLTKKEKYSLKKLVESRKKSILYCSKAH